MKPYEIQATSRNYRVDANQKELMDIQQVSSKTPDEIVPIVFGFDRLLLDDEITAAELSIAFEYNKDPSVVDEEPLLMITEEGVHDAKSVQQLVSGGIKGSFYLLSCRVEAALGAAYEIGARFYVD